MHATGGLKQWLNVQGTQKRVGEDGPLERELAYSSTISAGWVGLRMYICLS